VKLFSVGSGTVETVQRCLGNSRLPSRYRGNALLFETYPVLASRCAATDLLVAAETRLTEPLPRHSRTNLPVFRQHVAILMACLDKNLLLF
jgi:hypothetical protein